MGHVIDSGGWSGRLCPGSLTPSILWSTKPPAPHCLHPTPKTHPCNPHQLLLTPHHSPASACHVLGVKGVPTYRSSKWNPTISCPRALNHNQSLGRQRWIGTSTTLYLSAGGCCHWRIIVVILGGVSGSSLPPLEGSYHKAMEGNSFLFRDNGHCV